MMGSVFVNGGIVLGIGWMLFELMDWIATLSFSKKHCKLFVRVAVFVALSFSVGVGWLGATVTISAQAFEKEQLFKTAHSYNMESTVTLKVSQ